MFKGNAEEAMTFYRSVFGGEFTYVMRYKDMPADANTGENKVSKDMLDKLMHIELTINDNMTLMANDNTGEHGPLKKAINMQSAYRLRMKQKQDVYFIRYLLVVRL